MSRKKYLHYLISDLILNCKELNTPKKDIIIDEIHQQTKTFSDLYNEFIEHKIIKDLSNEDEESKNYLNLNLNENATEKDMDSYFDNFSRISLYMENPKYDINYLINK